MLGQRYAFDFIRVDQRVRLHYHPAVLLRTLVLGVPTSECYAWGAPGQSVRAGDVVGRVGHTGNSTTPHLHAQLMDAADPTVARGVPIAFRAYDVLRHGAWQMGRDGIPGKANRVRANEPAA